MTTIEKIKTLNAGIALGKMHTRIYLGTEDELMLFRRIIAALGIEVDYEIEDCEVIVKEVIL